jgi:hypothetical protein
MLYPLSYGSETAGAAAAPRRLSRSYGPRFHRAASSSGPVVYLATDVM